VFSLFNQLRMLSVLPVNNLLNAIRKIRNKINFAYKDEFKTLKGKLSKTDSVVNNFHCYHRDRLSFLLLLLNIKKPEL